MGFFRETCWDAWDDPVASWSVWHGEELGKMMVICVGFTEYPGQLICKLGMPLEYRREREREKKQKR